MQHFLEISGVRYEPVNTANATLGLLIALQGATSRAAWPDGQYVGVPEHGIGAGLIRELSDMAQTASVIDACQADVRTPADVEFLRTAQDRIPLLSTITVFLTLRTAGVIRTWSEALDVPIGAVRHVTVDETADIASVDGGDQAATDPTPLPDGRETPAV